MPLSEIRPAPRNAKRHAEAEIQDSFDEFGSVESMALDERTGRLVAGHGRYGALVGLRERGKPPPEGVMVDPQTGDWLAPVQRGWASASDRHAEAYLVISNQHVIKGGFDDRELAATLDDLNSWDPASLDMLGFDDLDSVLAAYREPADPDLPEPAAPEKPSTDDESSSADDSNDDGGSDGDKQVRCPSCGHHFPARV